MGFAPLSCWMYRTDGTLILPDVPAKWEPTSDAWITVYQQRTLGTASSFNGAVVLALRHLFDGPGWVAVPFHLTNALLNKHGYRIMRNSEWRVLGQLETELTLSS